MTQRRPALVFALMLIAVLLIYLLRLDPVAGLLVDDAWYIVLAKSLASGHGYRLISSATVQVQPAVPPGYPALLAPIVALIPQFPDHVIWMKLLSIAAIFAAGGTLWFDFVRHREIPPLEAALIVTASLLTPALVFLATSAVMAEGVFMLLQAAAVVAVERITRRDQGDHRAAILAGALSAAALLVRTAAAALIVAALAYLLINRRWRQVATYVVTMLVCLMPWWVYSSAHAPTAEERDAHGGNMAASYTQLLTSADLADPARAAGVSQLMQRAVDNVRIVLTSDVGALIVPSLYRSPGESGEEVFSVGRPGFGNMGVAWGTMIVSAAITLLVAIGWFASSRERWALPGLLLAATLPMVAPVAGQTFRYIVPLAPYVVMLMWRGWRWPRAARIALLVVIGLHAGDHALYIHEKFTAVPEWIDDWKDNNQLLSWVKEHVPEDQGIAATNPGLIYLATGRKTVAIDNMQRNWRRWKDEGVPFVSSTQPHSAFPPRSLGWRERFRSDRNALWVVEITSE